MVILFLIIFSSLNLIIRIYRYGELRFYKKECGNENELEKKGGEWEGNLKMFVNVYEDGKDGYKFRNVNGVYKF